MVREGRIGRTRRTPAELIDAPKGSAQPQIVPAPRDLKVRFNAGDKAAIASRVRRSIYYPRICRLRVNVSVHCSLTTESGLPVMGRLRIPASVDFNWRRLSMGFGTLGTREGPQNGSRPPRSDLSLGTLSASVWLRSVRMDFTGWQGCLGLGQFFRGTPGKFHCWDRFKFCLNGLGLEITSRNTVLSLSSTDPFSLYYD